MVKPNQPKGLKPKAEVTDAPIIESAPSEGLSGQKLIIVNTIITVIICTLFLGGNFLIVNGVVGSKLENFKGAAETPSENPDEGGGGEAEQPEKGVILDLGEFILNLSDPSAKRYLKVNVALELSKSPNDPELDAEGKGGGHGEGKAAPDPYEIIEKEMKQYKPAIRDAVISVLSSKTTEELSSLTGKELAKEQLKEAIDPIFAGERQVIRVSFGTFIIQ